MLSKTLDDITEADLARLTQDQIRESLRLEFKRELNIGNRDEKAEAAKDIAAMANSAGGRIIFGIDECELPDGSKVAGVMTPLSDGTIQERLEDVLYSVIHPRPRLRMRAIPVSGGYVLVAEVYPSFDRDLHMVTNPKGGRFYRRGETRVIPMTEPEIREAYARIAATKQALDSSIEHAISLELAKIPKMQESIFVIPFYGHRRLVDPQQLGLLFGQQVANKSINFSRMWGPTIAGLQIESDGYRVWGPEDYPREQARRYASVLRNGVVHLATALNQSAENKLSMKAFDTVEMLVASLAIARDIYERSAYWGPVRVTHRVLSSASFRFDLGKPHFLNMLRTEIREGEYIHEVPEVHWEDLSRSFKPVACELCHGIFQMAGNASCPWFDAAGNWTDEMLAAIEQSSIMKYVQ